MTDYHAQINRKGTDGTGITEDVARNLYGRRGSGHMAVVELLVDETSEKASGARKVALVIGAVELVLDDQEMDAHLRNLQRTIHYNRQVAAGQAELEYDDGPAPKVTDVLKTTGRQLEPHPFILAPGQDDKPDEQHICDVCGTTETDTRHAPALLADGGDQEEQGGEGEQLPLDEPDEPDTDPADDDKITQRNPFSVVGS